MKTLTPVRHQGRVRGGNCTSVNSQSHSSEGFKWLGVLCLGMERAGSAAVETDIP